MRSQLQGFLSFDQAMLCFIHAIREELPPEFAVAFSRRLIGRRLAPEKQAALARLDEFDLLVEELWSGDPNGSGARAAQRMKEALSTENLFAYVFLGEGNVKRVPSTIWRTPHGDYCFENGRIDLSASGRELALKCWLRFDEIRDYFAGWKTAPQYPLLSLEQGTDPSILPKGSAQPTRKTGAGRPTVYRWAEIAAEATHFIIQNDLPETQAKLEAHLAEWYEAEFDEETGEHTFRDFVSCLFKRRRATKLRR